MDHPELCDRDRAILAAIIEQHILTAEPVGSSRLLQHLAFGVSSATVRNSMARLEEAGFLFHPYTSAGKVPTVKAYRYFVERLMPWPSPDNAPAAGVRTELLQQVKEVDQLVQLTAGVLAAVSQLLAVSWVSYPAREQLARVELVPVATNRFLLMAFTSSAQEIHQVLECKEPMSAGLLQRVAGLINERAQGLGAAELAGLATAEWPGLDRRLQELLRRALAALGTGLQRPGRDEMILEGADNLIGQPEFNDIASARRLVSVLDRREALLKPLAAPGLERAGVRIVVGAEDLPADIPSLSLITIGVALPGGRQARMGILGPLRMPYSRIFSLLGYTAATLKAYAFSD